eukprot:156945_1
MSVTMSARPQHAKNETVYIRNLNEKLSKDELRTCLYLFFSQFGQILDIVAMKTMKMRGQAFVVFKDTRSATKAIDGGHGANFFGEVMDVSYAKTKSKKLLEHQGKLAQAAAINKKPSHQHKQFGGYHNRSHHNNRGNKSNENRDEYSRLRIEDVPINPNIEQMKTIFGKFAGFVRILYDESNPGVCFVEYSNQNQSVTAMDKLQGLNLNGSSLRIVLDNIM